MREDRPRCSWQHIATSRAILGDDSPHASSFVRTTLPLDKCGGFKDVDDVRDAMGDDDGDDGEMGGGR